MVKDQKPAAGAVWRTMDCLDCHNRPSHTFQPPEKEIDAALAVAYRSNVFPSMKIGWGTYPNHIGHETSPGCFRCHDDAHAAPDGQTISQDCSTCHSLLAMGEEDHEILHSLEE
ncbi:MAG TPA: cytochrome c3 family protein [Thermoanaerobaculia bacterium]|nr:cytochrome c3 family protein [Thermoanaerobaculia bacterium]